MLNLLGMYFLTTGDYDIIYPPKNPEQAVRTEFNDVICSYCAKTHPITTDHKAAAVICHAAEACKETKCIINTYSSERDMAACFCHPVGGICRDT